MKDLKINVKKIPKFLALWTNLGNYRDSLKTIQDDELQTSKTT